MDLPHSPRDRVAHVRGDLPPQRLVADDFMAIRGYHGLAPTAVSRVRGEHLWYFEYDLDEGALTLEISWTDADGWHATVWDFQRH